MKTEIMTGSIVNNNLWESGERNNLERSFEFKHGNSTFIGTLTIQALAIALHPNRRQKCKDYYIVKHLVTVDPAPAYVKRGYAHKGSYVHRYSVNIEPAITDRRIMWVAEYSPTTEVDSTTISLNETFGQDIRIGAQGRVPTIDFGGSHQLSVSETKTIKDVTVTSYANTTPTNHSGNHARWHLDLPLVKGHHSLTDMYLYDPVPSAVSSIEFLTFAKWIAKARMPNGVMSFKTTISILMADTKIDKDLLHTGFNEAHSYETIKRSFDWQVKLPTVPLTPGTVNHAF